MFAYVHAYIRVFCQHTCKRFVYARMITVCVRVSVCVVCHICTNSRAVCVSIQEDEGNMFFKVTELVGFIWCFRFTSSFEITMMSLSKPRKNLSTEDQSFSL